jgi:hypothetical protein
MRKGGKLSQSILCHGPHNRPGTDNLHPVDTHFCRNASINPQIDHEYRRLCEPAPQVPVTLVVAKILHEPQDITDEFGALELGTEKKIFYKNICRHTLLYGPVHLLWKTA